MRANQERKQSKTYIHSYTKMIKMYFYFYSHTDTHMRARTHTHTQYHNIIQSLYANFKWQVIHNKQNWQTYLEWTVVSRRAVYFRIYALFPGHWPAPLTSHPWKMTGDTVNLEFYLRGLAQCRQPRTTIIIIISLLLLLLWWCRGWLSLS